MSLSIDSKEAYEIALVNSTKKEGKLYEEILFKIRKASEDGNFRINVQDPYFTEDIRNKLEKLGFTTWRMGIHGMISWDK